MQLPGHQNDSAALIGSKPQCSPNAALSGGSDAPASPSSPGSPTKIANATREKPAKVIPCPRCESMNTKFCYYNNYSVTQPRHFCRQCQRYWTAGGTLRNVPVGGGSRKKSRHPRGGAAEPYLQRAGSYGVASAGEHSIMQNVGFQQMLTQDMVGLNFAQLPGFVPPNTHHYVPCSMDHSDGVYAPMTNKPPGQEDLSNLNVLYGTAPMGGYYPAPEMGGENSGNAVKPEFWATSMAAPRVVVPGSNPSRDGRLDSSMLLNLGLNNRSPTQGGGNGKPMWDHQDVKPALPQQKNGSPPHGSSTIEEEGSTPTNGYSNNRYEEGDTVSSMWHDMQHDLDNIFQ